jgi:CPA1 family monovalent cation:H+ antiporter
MDIPYLLAIIMVASIVVGLTYKIKIQAEIFVLIFFAIASFILPHFEMSPHVLLVMVLPPLLFSSARNIGGNKFEQLKWPILSLGIGLVIFTAFSVASIAYIVLPVEFRNFGALMILGAVVAPIDAVSAISIGKKVNMNSKVLNIMTGESLINDATSLTLFSAAVALTTGVHTETENPILITIYNFLVNNPVIMLFYTLLVGAIVGLGAGMLTGIVRKFVKDSSLITIFTLVVPWVVYIVAEKVLASGVIATVVSGFVVERFALNSTYNTRIQERVFWKSLDTLLETFAFAYMGLQTKSVMDIISNEGINIWVAIACSIPIFFVVVLTRPIWIALTESILKLSSKIGFSRQRRISKTLYSKFSNVEQRHKKREEIIQSRNKLKVDKSFITNFSEGLILSWAGMRGVVTISVAASIPELIASDSGQPIYGLLLFFAMTVVLYTLIIQGLTLPLVVKRFSKEDKKASIWEKHHKEVARKILENSAKSVIDEVDEEEFPIDKNQLAYAYGQFSANNNSVNQDTVLGVLHDIVAAQRENIIDAVKNGELDSDIAKTTLDRLDHRQALGNVE